ncbi:MAG: potassium-transporting ATPase subunit KdpC [Vulcanimicrobiaceae bacterium]
MIRHMGVALRMTLVTVVLLGLIYPLAMTGIAQVAFPHQANGSMIVVGGKAVGSQLVGQLWTRPQYFQGRPSAAGSKGYDPTATGGTNLGPSSKKLIDATRATIAALRKANPNATGPIPMDLVTSSGSGIDPDISPEAAYYQAPRVAAARRLPLATVQALVARQAEGREFGFLGEPRVNVLQLNLALDALR